MPVVKLDCGYHPGNNAGTGFLRDAEVATERTTPTPSSIAPAAALGAADEGLVRSVLAEKQAVAATVAQAEAPYSAAIFSYNQSVAAEKQEREAKQEVQASAIFNYNESVRQEKAEQDAAASQASVPEPEPEPAAREAAQARQGVQASAIFNYNESVRQEKAEQEAASGQASAPEPEPEPTARTAPAARGGTRASATRAGRKHVACSILLTGGCGFIGAWVARALRATYPAARIVVLDKLDYCSSTVNLEGVVGVDVIEGSTTDPALVLRLLRERNVDTIVHMAAQVCTSLLKRVKHWVLPYELTPLCT